MNAVSDAVMQTWERRVDRIAFPPSSPSAESSEIGRLPSPLVGYAESDIQCLKSRCYAMGGRIDSIVIPLNPYQAPLAVSFRAHCKTWHDFVMESESDTRARLESLPLDERRGVFGMEEST